VVRTDEFQKNLYGNKKKTMAILEERNELEKGDFE